MIIDIYSRYVVAWMVAEAETGELAEAFIADAVAPHGIEADQLTLHADRGSSMTSKTVAQLLVDLGVARSHGRPHVSNDNPYSEATRRRRCLHGGAPHQPGPGNGRSDAARVGYAAR